MPSNNVFVQHTVMTYRIKQADRFTASDSPGIAQSGPRRERERAIGSDLGHVLETADIQYTLRKSWALVLRTDLLPLYDVNPLADRGNK